MKHDMHRYSQILNLMNSYCEIQKGRILVLSCMAANGVGNLYFIKAKTTSLTYIDSLRTLTQLKIYGTNLIQLSGNTKYNLKISLNVYSSKHGKIYIVTPQKRWFYELIIDYNQSYAIVCIQNVKYYLFLPCTSLQFYVNTFLTSSFIFLFYFISEKHTKMTISLRLSFHFLSTSLYFCLNYHTFTELRNLFKYEQLPKLFYALYMLRDFRVLQKILMLKMSHR